VAQSVKPKANHALVQQATYGAPDALYAISRAGFGKVAVLGFDPSVLKWAQADQAAQFWVAPMSQLLLTKNSAERQRMIIAKGPTTRPKETNTTCRIRIIIILNRMTPTPA